MEIELWKDIPEYEGHYQVSNLGRVKSLPRIRKGGYGHTCSVNERILKPKTDRYGYLTNALSMDSKMKHFTIHRLVAMCFVHNPNPEKFNQVNHKDGNKLNNRWDNLEWCDALHNSQEALRLGLRGGKPYRPRIDSCPINQFDKNGNFIKRYDSLAQAERLNGVTSGCISNSLTGRSKSSLGYVWVYAEKEKPAKLS